MSTLFIRLFILLTNVQKRGREKEKVVLWLREETKTTDTCHSFF